MKGDVYMNQVMLSKHIFHYTSHIGLHDGKKAKLRSHIVFFMCIHSYK